jgi:hypothetical protein
MCAIDDGILDGFGFWQYADRTLKEALERSCIVCLQPMSEGKWTDTVVGEKKQKQKQNTN